MVPFRTLADETRSFIIEHIKPMALARMCVASKGGKTDVVNFCHSGRTYSGACDIHFRDSHSIISPRTGNASTIKLSPHLSEEPVHGCEGKHVGQGTGFVIKTSTGNKRVEDVHCIPNSAIIRATIV